MVLFFTTVKSFCGYVDNLKTMWEYERLRNIYVVEHFLLQITCL